MDIAKRSIYERKFFNLVRAHPLGYVHDVNAADQQLGDDDGPEAAKSTGTQSLSRATLILRLIARRGIEGARLTQLTKLSGLPHPTVRRMLKCLIDERLVVQDNTTRRYRLGPLNFELGLATIPERPSWGSFSDILERLARQTGDTVYLMARSGADVVCLERAEGHFPIRAHTFDVGGRRPLGFGAAGLALLATLADEEIEAVLRINAKEIEQHTRITTDYLRSAVAKTRERGFAVTSDIYTVGIGSVGLALPAERGLPTYAINISTVGLERFNPRRIADLQRVMADSVSHLLTPRPASDAEVRHDFVSAEILTL